MCVCLENVQCGAAGELDFSGGVFCLVIGDYGDNTDIGVIDVFFRISGAFPTYSYFSRYPRNLNSQKISDARLFPKMNNFKSNHFAFRVG